MTRGVRRMLEVFSLFSLFSTLLFFVFSLPLYLWYDYVFYPLRIVVYSFAFIAIFSRAVFPLYVFFLLLCLPGLGDPKYTLYMFPVYNLAAYLVGGLVSRGWRRLVLIPAYWILLQLVEVSLSLIATATGFGTPRGSTSPAPNPIFAPYYILGYMMLMAAFGYVVKRVDPNCRPWLSRVLSRRFPRRGSWWIY